MGKDGGKMKAYQMQVEKTGDHYSVVCKIVVKVPFSDIRVAKKFMKEQAPTIYEVKLGRLEFQGFIE